MTGNEKYLVIQGTSIAHLAEKVNEHMAKGWLPSGGVATGNTGTLNLYYQAITRK